MTNLAVAVSGTGSLLEAMIEEKLPIKFVLADRPCRGIQIAGAAGIDFVMIPRTFGQDFDRVTYTRQAAEALKTGKIDLIAMAGFMTVWSPHMFDYYDRRVINTHPSLLPSFKGDHAVADALAAGVKVTGCTIHFATEKLDEGPILAQAAVSVEPFDTVATLHERIKRVERKLYPRVIREQIDLLHRK